MSKFFQKLKARAESVDSLLCVGLDPHSNELEEDSAEGAYRFAANLIEETKDVAAAYKPNVAYFEAYGSAGVNALERVLQLIPADIPIVLDAKRGDIGATSEAYARSAYESFGCGSVTVSPYLGGDAVAPFLKDGTRVAWLLCKTSNPGSADLQTVEVSPGRPLYLHVASLVCGQWAKEHNNAGLVVGATDVEALRRVRAEFPNVWFLSPGVGAQGGDLSAALEAGLSADGFGILLPISRGISKAADPRKAADDFRKAINAERKRKCNGGK